MINRVKHYREKIGMPITHLARYARTSFEEIKNIEENKRQPDLVTAIRIARTLNKSVEHLFDINPDYKPDLRDVKRLAAQGFTLSEAARKLSMNRPALVHLSIKHGIEFQRRSNRIEQYQELANQGMTMKQAAKAMNVHYQTVANMASRYNIQFKKREKLSAVAVQEKADNGLTVSEASKELGIHYQSLYQFAKRNNISFRKKNSK